jgi:hypothetical protein
MRSQSWKSIAVSLAILALAAGNVSSVIAQDRPDDHRDAKADEHHDDHAPPRPDEKRGDPAEQYRHDHPHASARCHDGFFTTTKDRAHACGKHGGIDVWLAL